MSSLKLLLFFLFFSALQQQARAGSTFIRSGCSPSNFLPTSLSIHLNTLLTSIAFSAFQTSYNSYATSTPTPHPKTHKTLPSTASTSATTTWASLTAHQHVYRALQASSVSSVSNLMLCPCSSIAAMNFLGKLNPCLHTRNAVQAQLTMGSFFQKRDDALGDLQNGAS